MGKALRCAVHWVWIADIDTRVKDGNQPQGGDLFIDRKHSILIDEKMLVIRMQLYALQARRVDALEFVKRARALRMDAAEGVKIGKAVVCINGEMVDALLLARVGGNIEHHSAVCSAGKDLLQKALRRALVERDRVARAEGEACERLFGDLFRETVGVKIDDAAHT